MPPVIEPADRPERRRAEAPAPAQSRDPAPDGRERPPLDWLMLFDA